MEIDIQIVLPHLKKIGIPIEKLRTLDHADYEVIILGARAKLTVLINIGTSPAPPAATVITHIRCEDRENPDDFFWLILDSATGGRAITATDPAPALQIAHAVAHAVKEGSTKNEAALIATKPQAVSENPNPPEKRTAGLFVPLIGLIRLALLENSQVCIEITNHTPWPLSPEQLRQAYQYCENEGFIALLQNQIQAPEGPELAAAREILKTSPPVVLRFTLHTIGEVHVEYDPRRGAHLWYFYNPELHPDQEEAAFTYFQEEGLEEYLEGEFFPDPEISALLKEIALQQ